MVKCEVDETFKDNVKSNVSIKNTGDTTAYIRAFVNVTWMNESGQVASVSPKSTDYMIEYSTSGWLKGSDGYYYYSLPVQPNNKTAVLINSCRLLETASAPDGYYLSVEIVCSSIQSTPVSVVSDIWHVQLSGSEIVEVNVNE